MSTRHEERVQFFIPHGGIIDPENLESEAMGVTLQEGRLLHISSSVDMENPVTVSCAGAVLAYLQRRQTADILPINGISELFKIRSVEMFGLNDTM